MSYDFFGVGFVLYYKWVFVFLLLTIVLFNRRHGATGCEQSSDQTAREKSFSCPHCQANVTHTPSRYRAPLKANSDGDSHDGVEVIKKKRPLTKTYADSSRELECLRLAIRQFLSPSSPSYARTHTRNHSQSDDCRRSHCCYPSSLPRPHNTNTYPHPPTTGSRPLSFFCLSEPPLLPPLRHNHLTVSLMRVISVGSLSRWDISLMRRRLPVACLTFVLTACLACVLCVCRACVRARHIRGVRRCARARRERKERK